MTYSVYTLSDPRDNQIRYVGITSRVEIRYKEHTTLKPANHSEEKLKWTKELNALGLAPVMEIIHSENTLTKAKEVESITIWTFTLQGIRLFNKEVYWYWKVKDSTEA